MRDCVVAPKTVPKCRKLNTNKNMLGTYKVYLILGFKYIGVSDHGGLKNLYDVSRSYRYGKTKFIFGLVVFLSYLITWYKHGMHSISQYSLIFSNKVKEINVYSTKYHMPEKDIQLRLETRAITLKPSPRTSTKQFYSKVFNIIVKKKLHIPLIATWASRIDELTSHKSLKTHSVVLLEFTDHLLRQSN